MWRRIQRKLLLLPPNLDCEWGEWVNFVCFFRRCSADFSSFSHFFRFRLSRALHTIYSTMMRRSRRCSHVFEALCFSVYSVTNMRHTRKNNTQKNCMWVNRPALLHDIIISSCTHQLCRSSHFSVFSDLISSFSMFSIVFASHFGMNQLMISIKRSFDVPISLSKELRCQSRYGDFTEQLQQQPISTFYWCILHKIRMNRWNIKNRKSREWSMLATSQTCRRFRRHNLSISPPLSAVS